MNRIRFLPTLQWTEWLSLLVLALLLLVPSWLYLLKQSTLLELANIRHHAKVAVFLARDTNVDTAKRIVAKAQALSGVASVTLVEADQAMQTFKAHSGFGAQLDTLGDKVLPHTLFIKPVAKQTEQQTAQLVEKLTALQGVDLVRLDSFWSEKLLGLLSVLDRAFVLALLAFAFAFVVVVFFVTQVLLSKVRLELRLKLLLGATHGSIIRGYVAQSMVLAAFSALLSIVMTALMLWWLQQPLLGFARTFSIGLALPPMTSVWAMVLILFAVLLAAITAALTCKRVLFRLDRHLERADGMV